MKSQDSQELLRNALVKIKELKAQLKEHESKETEPIAVVGLACRFPAGGNSPEAFWQAMKGGLDGIRRLPAGRWSEKAMDDERPALHWAGLLETIDEFDAGFFGISPREAAHLDPQQRLVLEMSWEALENAGQIADRLVGARTGVFLGMCSSDYQQLVLAAPPYDTYGALGNMFSTAAGRISYTFGFQGPCVTIDTACSSSLTAVHLACTSLRLGESDMALAGGVNLILTPTTMNFLAALQALSPDGRCKAFDSRANGFVRGEGCGMVVLKRLSDAIRDSDQVLAVVRGSVVNQDGRSTGMTAPNVLSQKAMLRRALEVACLQPEDIGYIETHGTGTSLGDPIEFEALREVIGVSRADGSKCILGAVKSNIGHLEGAAGISGLVKAVLCLRNGAIPKNLHFKTLNPRISLEGTPFVIPTETIPWKSSGKPRRAGVSSFGISGTNAHVILEEVPVREEKPIREASSYLLPLSAKTPEALTALAKSYQEWFAHGDESLHHVAYTASMRRSHLECRLGVVGSTKEEIAAALGAFAAGEMAPSVVTSKTTQSAPKVMFVFPGQGSQWVGMGRQLSKEEPAFRDALSACDEAIRKEAGFSVVEELDKPEETSRLNETIVAQPALFAIEVALAALLQSWGVVPSAVVGHSVGEIAAAHVAGMLDLAQASRLVALRARVMQKATGHGKMVSVGLTEQDAQKAIAGFEDRVGIAAVNDPSSVVLSGDIESVDIIVQRLLANNVQTRPLRVNYAFHSPQMEALLPAFIESVGVLNAKPGTIPMLSTVTGKNIAAENLDTKYWARNIRQTVRFADAITSSQDHVFVEVGPHPVLAISMEQTLSANNVDGKVIPTLRRNKDERKQALLALGALHVHGGSVDWKKFSPEGGRVVELPTYPWQRKRYWIDAPNVDQAKLKSARQEYNRRTGHHPLLGAPFLPSIPSKARFWQHSISTFNVPWLAAHLVQGEIVFPGTGYIECMLAAGLAIGGQRPLLLEEVNFERIMAVGQQEEREFQVVMLEENGSSNVQVASQSNADMAWTIHARGIVREVVSEFGPAVESPEQISARLSYLVDGADIYERLWNRQVHLGLPFRGIVRMRVAETEVLAQIRLPDGVDPSEYVVHPALLDACLQASTGFGILSSDTATYIPSRIERLHFYSRPLRECWVLLTKQQEATTEHMIIPEVRVMDEHGRPFVVISGLHCRKILQSSRQSEDALEGCVYESVWREIDALQEPNPPLDGKWLIFTDRGGLGDALVGPTSPLGRSSVLVSAGSSYQKLASDRFQIDPAKPEDHQRLLQDVFEDDGRCAGVVFLPSLDATPFDRTTPASLVTDLVHATVSAAHALQALLRHGFGDMPPLFLVTRGAQSVLPNDPVSVAQSPILGLGKSIAMEHPEVDCRNIDLSPYPSEHDAALLLRELGSKRNEGPIALRGQSRHGARLVRGTWEMPLDKNVNIRPDRTYLLTGGLGGLGLSLATWLVEQGARNLVLLGRNGPASEAMHAIEAMQHSGARVWTMKIDISLETDANQLFMTIREKMPPLGGVVHLAAVLEDRMLLDQSKESFERVFAPKALGAWNLHQHCKGLALDFFVLYSSAAGLIGSPGQSNYSAANTFLDALAHERVRLGLPASSIQWGAFSDVGMAAARENRGNRIASRGMVGLKPAEGLEALRRLLATHRTELSIARFDVHQWSESYPSMRQLAFFAELLENAAQRRDAAQAGGSALRIALANARPEERLALIKQFLARELGHILQLEPSTIQPDASMFELGLDSLMRVELRSRIGAGLGFEPSIVALSRYDQFAAFAAHLLEHVSLTGTMNNGTPQEEPTDTAAADDMEKYTF